MSDLPTCSKCGQDEEFLISESGEYLCLCGYRFKVAQQRTSTSPAYFDTYRLDNQYCSIH